jgi:hypothetical protein
MNWKLLIIGASLLSSFIISIALIAVYYDDSMYVGLKYESELNNPSKYSIYSKFELIKI